MSGQEAVGHHAAAHTRFSLELLRTVAAAAPAENLVLSPISVALALGLVHGGAAPDLQAAIARTLGVEAKLPEALHQKHGALMASLAELNQTPEQCLLAIATSLWADEGVRFSEDFQAAARPYQAQLEQADLDAPAAIEAINQWVSRQTRGRIDSILSQIDPLTVLVLLNAVYLKATWAPGWEFHPTATKETPFHLPGGQEKRVPMMFKSGFMPYLEDGQFQVTQLDFAQQRLRMLVALPAREMALTDLSAAITDARWAKWTTRLPRLNGRLGLPRFKISSDLSLVRPLGALGLASLFDPDQAQFPGIESSLQPVALGDARHTGYLEVNEAGVEAAAVTVVIMAGSAPPQQEPFKMIVDRPFFWAIYDDLTAAIVFAGFVSEPHEAAPAVVNYDEWEAVRRR